MKEADAAEVKALQSLSDALTIAGHQIEQGRGVGFFRNAKYKLFGSKRPDPLPTDKKKAP